MMKTVARTLVGLSLLAVATATYAAGEGTAVGVDPDAAARLNSTDRVLEVGADVSVGETIVTGAAGQVQIIFDDQTRLVVGPNSSLLIETYLLASNNTAEKLAINALGGSFRFITGNSAKPAYSIKTPTAAIAVRGTEFDMVVGNGVTGVLLYEGALQICGPGNQCQELTDRCDLATASGQQTDLVVISDAKHRPLAQQFRYARFQSKLQDPFRVGGAIFCTEEKPESAGVVVTLSTETEKRQPTEPEPNPNPEPTPDPQPEPTPDPIPSPQPTPDPVPSPEPTPQPDPVPNPRV